MLKTILKTAMLAAAVAALFLAFVYLQLETGTGPAAAMARTPGGSAEWFASAQSLVTLGTYVIWPLLIAAGSVLQRLWCPRAPWWSAGFIALPAIFFKWGQPAACLAYLALALLIGFFVRPRAAAHP